MKELTSAQKRKILYNYYRDEGYSPSQARNMRGRWKTVWSDYADRVKEIKNFGGVIPKPPKLPMSKREKQNITATLKKQGISNKVASQWVKVRPDRLYNRVNNLDKYWKTIEGSLKTQYPNKKATRLLRKMKRDMSRYRSNHALFEVLGDLYDKMLGIAI